MAFGSGSYASRLPKPPASTDDGMKLDPKIYGLGQKLYDGKIKPAAEGDPQVQLDRLKALQNQLPKSAAKKKDLVAFAGKLSAEQLQALEYFVQHRFPLK